jgi:uncharacterized membrane protein
VAALALAPAVAGGLLATSGAAAAVAGGSRSAVAGGWPWCALLIAFFVLASALPAGGRADKGARTGRVSRRAGGATPPRCSPTAARSRRSSPRAPPSGPRWAPTPRGRSPAPRPARSPPRRRNLGHRGRHGRGRHAAHGAGLAPGAAGDLGRGHGGRSLALVAGATVTAGTALLFGLPPSAAAGALAGGLAGAWADTFAGAAVQERRRCDRCGEDTEQRVHVCGTPTRRRGGLPGLGNDAVNGLCTVAGAAVGAAVARLVPFAA